MTQEELQVDNGAYISFHKKTSRNKTRKNLPDCGILIISLQGKNPNCKYIRKNQTSKWEPLNKKNMPD